MATPWLTGQGSQAQEVPPKEFTSSEIFPETSNEIACEQCGLKHPAIEQAAVIGQPDPSEGEVPVGFVTLRRDVPEKAIQGFIRPFLKPWEMPVRIIVLKQMPFIQGRKVDRQALRKYLDAAVDS